MPSSRLRVSQGSPVPCCCQCRCSRWFGCGHGCRCQGHRDGVCPHCFRSHLRFRQCLVMPGWQGFGWSQGLETWHRCRLVPCGCLRFCGQEVRDSCAACAAATELSSDAAPPQPGEAARVPGPDATAALHVLPTLHPRRCHGGGRCCGLVSSAATVLARAVGSAASSRPHPSSGTRARSTIPAVPGVLPALCIPSHHLEMYNVWLSQAS